MDETENKYIGLQESLQPQCLSEKNEAYQSVLDIEERLRKKDATNIALTGPYGSGKSSILITLRNKYSNYKYLNISLATLKPSQALSGSENNQKNEDDKDKVSKLNLDRLIEYSILQQLIYKEKQETLPDSRFKRIFHLSDKKVRLITISILFAALSLIVVFEPSFLYVEWLCRLLDEKWMNVVGDTMSIVYLLSFLYLAISKIVPSVCNSRLNKLNLKDGEIEIVENTSIFNKHLDEILYFFEQTKYDVVILEDLDRFETTDIFVKLRELNLLLNESKVVGRKIFFIYAVRDDMFQDAERVKCFDYITTVIPIINRSNAKTQLKGELEKRGVTDIADKHLQELGFFLHDMRLLKNIANEYVQYREKLQKGICSEKLLGMIVYKNYYPQDFALLHYCKGVVYGLLNLKETLVAAKIEELESEYDKHLALRKANLKEKQLKECELRRIYVDAYRDKCGENVLQFKVGDSLCSLKEIASNENLFEKLISSHDVTYSYIATTNNYYNAGRVLQNTKNITFSEIEKAIDESSGYAERLLALRAAFNELDDVNYSDTKKDDIRSQSLSKIMADIDYKSNKEYASLKVPRMIEYLVVRGYIDENYYDYISYFYDNFIDAHDWEFVLDLKLNRAHSYDYHINNVEACIKEIPNTVFRTTAILNVELLDYLAENSSDRMNLGRLRVVLRTAINEKKYDFIASYYQKGRQQDVVFTQLYAQHKNLWETFEKNDDENDSLKLCWFKYAEWEQTCDASQKWLSKHYDFITKNLLEIGEEQWSELIQEVRYEFINLNDKSVYILETIAERDAYTLSQHNLLILVSCMLKKEVDSLSYRLVKETEDQALIERVEADLGNCMQAVFAAPASEKESEATILGILMSSNVEEENKIKYLKNQQTKINLDIVQNDSEKTLALRCDVVEPTWENIIHYLNIVADKTVDNELVAFIDKHSVELSSMVVPCDPEEDEKMLLRQLIMTDLLTFVAYKDIVGQFTRWQLAGVPTIEERRVQLLIEKGMIRFNEQNTNDLLEHFSADLTVQYLLRYKSEFLRCVENIEYKTDVAVGLMKSNMSIGEKATIIPHFNIDIINEELADNIVSVLTKQSIDLPPDFLLKVMNLTGLFTDRLKVLNYALEKNAYAEETITAFIECLEEPYKSIAEKGKKPELPDTEDSRRLVSLLKDKNYISSSSDTKTGIRVYTKLK